MYIGKGEIRGSFKKIENKLQNEYQNRISKGQIICIF